MSTRRQLPSSIPSSGARQPSTPRYLAGTAFLSLGVWPSKSNYGAKDGLGYDRAALRKPSSLRGHTPVERLDLSTGIEPHSLRRLGLFPLLLCRRFCDNGMLEVLLSI